MIKSLVSRQCLRCLIESTILGKTQKCLELAALSIGPRYGREVLYIDTEGSFELPRFEAICKTVNVTPALLKDRLVVAKPTNFDDVEYALDEVSEMIDKYDIGTIIVDSVIDPLRTQYPFERDRSIFLNVGPLASDTSLQKFFH